MLSPVEQKKVDKFLETLYGGSGTEERNKFFSEMNEKFDARTRELIPGKLQIDEIQFGRVERIDDKYVVITTLHPHEERGIATQKIQSPRKTAERHGRIEVQLPVAIVKYRAKTDPASKVGLIPWDAGTFEYVSIISDYSL